MTPPVTFFSAFFRRLPLRAIGVFCLFCLLALLGAGLGVTYCGRQTYHWQAFDVELGVQPALRGQTRLVFTPLGEIRARTHRTPLTLSVSLSGISLEKLQALVAHPPPQAKLQHDLEQTARDRLTQFGLHQVLVGAVGGLIAPLLLRARRVRSWLFSSLLGGGAVAGLLLITLHSYDRRAFRSLTYVGSLRQAATIMSLVRGAFDNAEALSDKLRLVAVNVNALYGRISAMPALEPGVKTVRILHISDIHNNSAAIGFVRELADRFQVNAVIDTGDLTDYGTPVEAPLSQALGRLAVPHVFVAGNHDSQATVRGVAATRNAVVLDEQPVQVAGLTILGAPDPSSARAGLGSVDTPPAALAAAAGQLADAVAKMPAPPDILCVHNPVQADPLRGKVPLILCGHLHRASIDTQGITVICNAGTTGGAGLRYFDHSEGVSLSAAVLTFALTPHPRLLFIDTIILNGSLSEYSLTRRTFRDPVPALPAALPSTTAQPPKAVP